MAERKLVMSRSPFFSGKRLVGAGEVWAVDDPIVVARPNAFRELEVKSSTEAPVVRRVVPKRTTSKAKSTSSKPKSRQAKKS